MDGGHGGVEEGTHDCAVDVMNYLWINQLTDARQRNGLYKERTHDLIF